MSEVPQQKPRGRGPGRPFQKGQSANPKGRPKGTRHYATMLAESLMKTDTPDIVRTVVEAARNGDMMAARIILDRIVPAPRGRPVRLELPPINSPADVVKAAAAITAEVASGELTAEEATAVTAVLEFQRKAIETADLEVRLQALEDRERTRDVDR